MSNKISAVAAAVPLLLFSACGQAESVKGEGAAQEAASLAPPSLTASGDIEKQNRKASAPAAPVALPKELTVQQLSGGWRVTRVFPPGKPPVTPPAFTVAGAILEIYPESMRWSYKPKGAKGLDDFCSEPVAGIVTKPAAIKKINGDFARAREQLGGKVKGSKKPEATKQLRQRDNMADGHPHAWYCGGGGQIGPSDGVGADFVMLSGDAMLLRWTGGQLIHLERLNRPAPKENMRPSDYKPDKT